jgi:trehalose/maltose hydrolase-like predicted phosphorylase
VLTDVSVLAKKDIAIIPASVMEAPPELQRVHNNFQQIGKISLLTSDAKSPTGKLMLAASTTFLFDDPGSSSPRVEWDSLHHLAQFHQRVPAGTVFHFSIAGSMISTQQTEDPVNEAERYAVYAALQGTGNLIRHHCQAWEELWKSDITIAGDDASQRDVHAALYHLYSFVRPGTASSISPMGLSGIGYNGHIFWDAELWMFPVLLVLHPEMAKSMIEYRCQRLPQAEQNAFAHGFKGAMYPWESDATGNEATPVWALTGPFEHHITADVAIAAWNYYRVTQDTSWLRQKGFPVIKACADFWVSRVEKDSSGNYNINNVVAADEWAENVDNNAFTNGAAKTNLHYAVLASKILYLPVDSDWITVGDHIPILKMTNGVTSEHATYQGEKIKQADVNLLAYPLKVITGTARIKKDLEYYSKRIGEGSPAMTHAIFAVLYARLHEPVKAWDAFEEAYIPNKKAPFGVLAETAGGTNPYFATGAGGFLQSVLFGFGGLEITSGGLVQIKTSLPPRWKSVTITGAGRSRQTFSVIQK